MKHNTKKTTWVTGWGCCTNETVSLIHRQLLQIMDARFHTGRHLRDILVMYCGWKSSFSPVV